MVAHSVELSLRDRKLHVEIWAIQYVQMHGIQACTESLDTVRLVDSCPTDEKSWKDAEFLKGCGKVQQDCVSSKRFLYHCILNDMMNATIEVCAPIRTMFGYCPVFTIIGARILHNYARECKQLSKPCPEDFESNHLYKYPECLDIPKTPSLTSTPQTSSSESMHITRIRWDMNDIYHFFFFT
ncbi:uncharacterized protein LOC133176241 [Saccostrea echinata]|uniref:uncharacterized protein LOC133176241 n=1 Tax=Saccostrea echinata TaxID=191078 RepID=UPI002A8171B3|nr:uncharacterized protein LOC133176241 [Saccostrea echinata]